MSSPAPQTETQAVEPQPNDVLCDDSQEHSAQEGNKLWHLLIGSNKTLYTSLPNKRDLLVRCVVDAVRSQNPPGRFLCKKSAAESVDVDEWWCVMSDEQAMELTRAELEKAAAAASSNNNETNTEEEEEHSSLPALPDGKEYITAFLAKPSPDTRLGIRLDERHDKVFLHSIVPDCMAANSPLRGGMEMYSINGEPARTAKEVATMLRAETTLTIIAIADKQSDSDSQHNSPKGRTSAEEQALLRPTAMLDAARRSDWDQVLLICQENPGSAAVVGPQGLTALHQLCIRPCPHAGVVERVIRAWPYALIRQDSNKHWTPLHTACRFRCNSLVVCKLLSVFPELGRQALSKVDKHGRTPFWYAVKYDAPAGVIPLLSKTDHSADKAYTELVAARAEKQAATTQSFYSTTYNLRIDSGPQPPPSAHQESLQQLTFSSSSSVSSTAAVAPSTNWPCEICDVRFYSLGALRAHRKGEAHRQKRRELRLEEWQEEDDPKLHCDSGPQPPSVLQQLTGRFSSWRELRQEDDPKQPASCLPATTTTTAAVASGGVCAREGCRNKAALECTNSCCLLCCRDHRNKSCPRHSTTQGHFFFHCSFGSCSRIFTSSAERDEHMKVCQHQCFACTLCQMNFCTSKERDIHIATDLGHLRRVHGADADDEVLAQLAISNLSLVGEEVDYSAPNDTARMLQREHDDAVVAVALYNYEAFYKMEHGTATYTQVSGTSAGIEGWAGSGMTNEPTTSNSSSSDGYKEQEDNDKKPAAATTNKEATKGDQEEAQMLRLAMMESALESRGVQTPDRAVMQRETSIQDYYYSDGEDYGSSSSSSSDEESYRYDDDNDDDGEEADEYHSDSESEAGNNGGDDAGPLDEDSDIDSDMEEGMDDGETDDGATRNDSSTDESWSQVSGGGTDGSWSRISDDGASNSNRESETGEWSLADGGDEQESFDELLLDG